MRELRLFFTFLRWDVVREIRRRETIANMSLFALLVLFVGQLGVDQDSSASVGPVFFWIAVLFAGTIGLSQTFAAEREDDLITGIITAPVDLGFFYLAKVVAVWLYVTIMEVLIVGAYALLFNFWPDASWGMFFLVISAFTLAYLGPGVVIAAMTTTLRGRGEVVLRILLIPLMLPVILLTFRVSEHLFGDVIAGGVHGPRMELKHYLAFTFALDTIYLTLGYLLFPKVLEE